MVNLKQKIIHGIFWQGLERFGSLCITFVINIILARLLSPAQFGIVAIVTALIDIATEFIDSGFSTALIQKKDADETDCNSVFYVNLILCTLIVLLIFPLAPYIARFYGKEELTILTRCIMLSLFFTSFASIQHIMLVKRMQFHLSFKIAWLAQIPSGIIGIILAYKGFGVWALVAQHLVKNFLRAILLYVFVRWHPQLLFSFKKLLALFSFGWKILCSNLLVSLSNNMTTMIIGKLFTVENLSFYQKGRHLPALGMNIVNSSIGRVFFPAFSSIQDNKAQVHDLAKRGLNNIMYLVIPIMGLLIVIAKPFVILLYTEKWLPCATFLQISCIFLLAAPFQALYQQIIAACGRSDLLLGLSVFHKLEYIALIFLTYRYGIVFMVCCIAINNHFISFIHCLLVQRLIDYSPWQQLADILPFLLITVFGVAISQVIRFIPQNNWLLVIAGTAIFTSVYLGMTVMTHQIPEDIRSLVSKITDKIYHKATC